MKCDEFQEMASAWSDNELIDGEAGGLFRHLGDCAECRASLRSQFEIRSGLREEYSPQAPVEMDKRVFTQIRNHRSMEPDRPARAANIWQRRFSLRVPVIAVATFLLIFGSVLLSSIWADSNQTADVRRAQTVFLTAVPAVEVRAYTLQPMTTKQ